MTTSTGGGLVPFAEGIWMATIPASILGMKLTTSMTVLRLRDDRLLLYSPTEMTPACREAVDAIGEVSHLYAPNLFHHLYIKEWSDAYPEARVHGPAGLEKKQPELRIDRIHGSSFEPDFKDVIEEFPIAGFRLGETVLLYRPARALLVADLVHHVGKPTHGWTRMYTKMMGFYDKLALSRMLRWTSFDDKAAARESIERILAAPFERLIVGHGTPVTSDAQASLRAACDWLL